MSPLCTLCTRGVDGLLPLALLFRLELRLEFGLDVVAVRESMSKLPSFAGLARLELLLLFLELLNFPVPNLPNRLPLLIADEPPLPLLTPPLTPPPFDLELRVGESLKSNRGVGSGKSKTKFELGLATIFVVFVCAGERGIGELLLQIKLTVR